MSEPSDITKQASDILRLVSSSAREKASRAATTPAKDDLYKLEKARLENGRLEMRNSALEAEIKRDGHLHLLRIITLVALFGLVAVWLGFVIKAIWLSAAYGNESYMGLNPDHVFKLSDSVLITFITSTTASVIGIFLIAANWLFPTNGKSTE